MRKLILMVSTLSLVSLMAMALSQTGRLQADAKTMAKSACQELAPAELAVLKWAADLRLQQQNSEPGMEPPLTKPYAQGASLLKTKRNLSALDRDCKGVLNYLGHDPKATAMLIKAGLQPKQARLKYSPLIDSLDFCNSQPEHARDSEAFLSQFSWLVKHLDIQQVDPAGKTALLKAAEYGLVAPLQILLKAGAQIEKSDPSGMTLLLLAADHLSWGDNQREQTFLALLQAGANVHARDRQGRTSLILAAAAHSELGIKTLLKRGVDKQRRDQSGRTAFDYLQEFIQSLNPNDQVVDVKLLNLLS